MEGCLSIIGVVLHVHVGRAVVAPPEGDANIGRQAHGIAANLIALQSMEVRSGVIHALFRSENCWRRQENGFDAAARAVHGAPHGERADSGRVRHAGDDARRQAEAHARIVATAVGADRLATKTGLSGLETRLGKIVVGVAAGQAAVIFVWLELPG